MPYLFSNTALMTAMLRKPTITIYKMANVFSYNKKINFNQGEILKFPNFDLKFIDSQTLEITAKGDVQKITYSSGDRILKFTVPFAFTRMPILLEMYEPKTLKITKYPPFPIQKKT